MQQPRQALVPFDATGLGIKSVLLIALLREFLFESPRPRPYSRIFDCDLVGEGPWSGAGPALNQLQVLARSKDIGFRTEVGHVDHKRVALPMAARVAEPLADVGRQVGASVHDDVALPPFSLTHVVEDRDAARGLHDPAETAGVAAKHKRPAGQAALCQRTVLRTIVAIHPPGIIAKKKF